MVLQEPNAWMKLTELQAQLQQITGVLILFQQTEKPSSRPGYKLLAVNVTVPAGSFSNTCLLRSHHSNTESYEILKSSVVWVYNSFQQDSYYVYRAFNNRPMPPLLSSLIIKCRHTFAFQTWFDIIYLSLGQMSAWIFFLILAVQFVSLASFPACMMHNQYEMFLGRWQCFFFSFCLSGLPHRALVDDVSDDGLLRWEQDSGLIGVLFPSSSFSLPLSVSFLFF